MLSSNRSGSSISVFFPAFNDEETIKPQAMDALAVLPSVTDDFEVLIVNDASTDSTPAVLDALAHARPHYPRRHERSQFFPPRRVARTAFDFLVLCFKLAVWRPAPAESKSAQPTSTVQSP